MNVIWLLFSVIMFSGITTSTFAQETTSIQLSNSKTDSLNVSYLVEHDHGIGSGKGELQITETGITFHSTDPKEVSHNRVWPDADIKRVEIFKKEIRLIVYESGRIVLLPGHFPFGKTRKSIPNGNEHTYNFHLCEEEISVNVVQRLLARFNRPLVTNVVQAEGKTGANFLFEISVFHRHRPGGESGMLRIYDQYVLFISNNEAHSRWWRYSDIRDIGRIGRSQFEVATYEGQWGTDGKSYIFDLKRTMTEAEYETLWKKLYGSMQ